MAGIRNRLFIAWLGLLVSGAGVLFAQRTPTKILVLNGRNAGPAVIQFGGRYYAEIDAIAQITNGSVTYQPDRVVLTIPNMAADGAAPQVVRERLSKEFAAAAIAAVAEMREWKDIVVTVIGFGVLVDDTWSREYHDRAEEGLKLATVAVSNTSDQSALQLLQSEFSIIDQWAGETVSTRRALNATRTMAPDAIRNDPVQIKIADCTRFLSSMLASGVYANSPNCH